MPRVSSGGRSSSGRSSARAPRSPPRPVAAAPPPPPAPVQSGNGSVTGGLGATIAEGMAFGTGSAMAHRAVAAVMGPTVVRHETVASPATCVASATMSGNPAGSDACGGHSKALQDCLNNYGTDISKCQFYMDMLSECRKNSGVSLGA